MASGRFPEARHDGQPWLDTDVARRDKGGCNLHTRAAIVYIKGDWAEYVSTLGLPSWNDGLRPCFCCNSPPDRLYEIAGIDHGNLPWRSNGDLDYEEACQRCEHKVVLDVAQHALVKALLFYDRRQHGNRGRCLMRAMPDLGLEVGDRLVPSPSLEDPGNFDAVVTFPIEVVFWRQSRDSLARNRNPVFDSSIGVAPVRSLTVDTLHCLYLGVFLAFARHLVWLLVLGGAWGDKPTQDEIIESAVIAIRKELAAWYKRRARDHPDERLTRISKFRRKTIGDRADQKLRTKGAETYGFMMFLLDMLATRGKVIGPAVANRLLQAGRSLEAMVVTWSAAGPNLLPQETRRVWESWNIFLSLTVLIPELELPKRHLTTHLLSNMDFHGNPTIYATWHDEGLNHTLKLACRTASQSTFEPMVLLRMKQLLSSNSRKRLRDD